MGALAVVASLPLRISLRCAGLGHRWFAGGCNPARYQDPVRLEINAVSQLHQAGAQMRSIYRVVQGSSVSSFFLHLFIFVHLSAPKGRKRYFLV